MISANGGLPAHRYTPQVTPRWPRGSEPASGTRDDRVHFPPGFVLAFALTLASQVVKGLIHIPLNQIQLLFREGVFRFSDDISQWRLAGT